jgi:ABC-type antimicrobial peptide transport system permease subunit
VDGIDSSTPGLGPLSAANITSGSSAVQQWFDQVNADTNPDSQLLALVSSSYAKANSIVAGSTVTVAGTDLTVMGVITTTAGSAGADIYAPLGEVQTLANDTAEVNTIYVTAANATDISTIQAEIQKLLPSATVTTAADLASQVSGSLSTATTLANTLGLWLSIAVLIAAFVLAALLTTASVNRRVREFGTLKAIGWRSRRIVGQVLGESVAQGIAGGVVGVGLGVLGAFVITKVAPTLSAVVGATGLGSTASTGGGAAIPSAFAGRGFGGGEGGFGASGGGGGSFVRQFANPNHSVAVHWTAPLNPEIFLLAIGLAIVGALIAGAIGGWRVARLQPADALRRVE